MFFIVINIIIDTSLVKIYDLIDKYFVSTEKKIWLFLLNTYFCIFLQGIAIYYLMSTIGVSQEKRISTLRYLSKFSIIGLSVLGGLFGYLGFQLFLDNHYSTWITVATIFLSYGIACSLLVYLCKLFLSWFRTNHNSIIFLYFISTTLILFNLIVVAIYTSISLGDRPSETREFVGGSIDISFGRRPFLDNLHLISSILSFVSIWLTTALLLKNYRRKIINTLGYWTLLSLPLVYFSINYFYQTILISLFLDYLTADPITISIIVVAFLSLSKPVGGLMFGTVFWNISKAVSYGKKIKTCMIISGWGILLIFTADQAISQALAPFPPFGLTTITVLILAAFLMLVGIYESASLVSINSDLRRTIYKRAGESKILDLIGRAEMEKEIQNTIGKIVSDTDKLEANAETNVELDEQELKKHLDFVLKEIGKIPKDD